MSAVRKYIGTIEPALVLNMKTPDAMNRIGGFLF